MIHTPVLLKEVIDNLHITEGGKYIDGTLGYGGHTKEIIKSGGLVLGIDQDPEIIAQVKTHINSDHLTIVEDNFKNIKSIAIENNFYPVDGILLDLGVSSYQLDTQNRGFSFLIEAPLDMRMSKKTKTTAADIVNTYTQKELFAILTQNAQEEKAWEIAKAITETRKTHPLATTTELANLIETIKTQTGKIHPATKTFQALRIAVNQELQVLESVLPDAFNLLFEGGRLCVVTFHEGEDRIVKNFIKKHKQNINNVSKKPILPTKEEIQNNPRSRSAKLRILQKKHA